MSAYVLSLLGASLAACMVELLVPKGDGGRIAGHVRMVAGLFLLVALLEPIGAGLTLLRRAAEGELTGWIEEQIPSSAVDGDSERFEDVFRESLNGVGRREVEAWVVESLETAFGIPAAGCAVEAVCDLTDGAGENSALRELRIGLRGAYALEDPHPIEAYFAERLGCPCYVTVVR